MVPVLRRADNVKRFGLNKANSAVLRLDSVIDEADKYVDQYLPGTVPEENHGETVHNLTRSWNSKKLSFISGFIMGKPQIYLNVYWAFSIPKFIFTEKLFLIFIVTPYMLSSYSIITPTTAHI